MKKILLLITIALLSYSSSFAIGGFKVVIKKPGAAVDVQVRIVDYAPTGPTTEFTGATVSLTPNASGIIVASVPETPAILATDVTSNYIVEVWTGSPLALSSQQRLDDMIFEQAQTGLTDNEGNVTLEPGKELIFPEPAGGGTNFTSFKSPALAADVEYTLPIDDGTPNQYLKTDGSGIMSWDTPPTSPTGTAGGSLAGTYPNPTIAAGAVTNTEVSGSAAIDASKLANGTVSNAELQFINSVTSNVQDQIDGKAASSHNHSTADVTSGTFANARISSSSVTQHESAITIGNLTGAPTGAVVGTTDAQTLTFKSIDSDNNTITNIVDADIKAGAAIAYSKLNLTTSIATGDLADDAVTAAKIGSTGGANGNVLTINAGNVEWAAPTGGGGGTFTQVYQTVIDWGGSAVFTYPGLANVYDDANIANESVQLLPAHNGELKKIIIRSNTTSSFTAGFYKNENTTAVESVTVSVTAGTNTSFDFSSSTFVAGDILNFSVDPVNGITGKVIITFVIEYTP